MLFSAGVCYDEGAGIGVPVTLHLAIVEGRMSGDFGRGAAHFCFPVYHADFSFGEDTLSTRVRVA